MQNQEGFSVIKFLFMIAVLAAGTWATYNILPVYTTYWKVQNALDAASRDLTNQSAEEIRAKLPDIFQVQYIGTNDLPQEFNDHLKIKKEGGKVEISSTYHVTVWLLGPLESVNPDEEYTAKGLKGMDKLRASARLDFDFEPYAETP